MLYHTSESHWLLFPLFHISLAQVFCFLLSRSSFSSLATVRPLSSFFLLLHFHTNIFPPLAVFSCHLLLSYLLLPVCISFHTRLTRGLSLSSILITFSPLSHYHTGWLHLLTLASPDTGLFIVYSHFLLWVLSLFCRHCLFSSSVFPVRIFHIVYSLSSSHFIAHIFQ